MPYCSRDPKREHNFDNYPHVLTNEVGVSNLVALTFLGFIMNLPKFKRLMFFGLAYSAPKAMFRILAVTDSLAFSSRDLGCTGAFSRGP